MLFGAPSVKVQAKEDAMNAPSQRSLRAHQSGSAVLAALAILAVILVAVGGALFEASHRFRTSNQSSRWAQAEQAAEAGAEIALLSAQNNSWVADGWPAAPGAPGAAAVQKTVTLDANVPAINTTVSVDTITMGSSNWLRIRSQGMADLPSSRSEGIDTGDITLRKLTLQVNRYTGAAVSTPQAIRMVEILAQPTFTPFQDALLLNKAINMSGGGVIDSFNSSDPTKSTSGLYDIAKRQTNGKVGINDTQGASDLKNTFVYGPIGYSGPPIANTGNVQGAITNGFSSPVLPVLAPIWSSYNLSPNIINGTTTLTGGPKSSPARYEVSSLNVAGGNVLTWAPQVAGQDSYVEIWVTGDFTTSGSGYILQQPGVHVTYYIGGNVTVSGGSFNNQSNLAANNSVNLITPLSGSQTLTVSGGGTFIGTLNAPGADITLSGSANFSGAMVGKTINISGGASLHYDEALGFNAGSAAYKVASWVEAVR